MDSNDKDAPVQYNLRSPAVKRLLREAKELKEPTAEYFTQPCEDNLFDWHFTIRGPPDSDFQDGIYHGRIILPSEYPMKPPSFMMLTPNGRFETGTKICLSISSYHPETWRPSWSIRTALLALISFMNTPGGGAIGAIDCPKEARRLLAKKSLTFQCPECGYIVDTIQYAYRKKSGENTDKTTPVAPRLFGLNHNHPEITAGQEREIRQTAESLIRGTPDFRSGDNVNLVDEAEEGEEPNLGFNFPLDYRAEDDTEEEDADDEEEEEEDLIETEGTNDYFYNQFYTYTIGIVVIGIASIILRRFFAAFNNREWA